MDKAINSTISYEIEYVEPSGYLRIDNVTGILSTTKKTDRDDPHLGVLHFTGLIKACQVENIFEAFRRCATAWIEIKINDLNDNAPLFQSNEYKVKLSEDPGDGTEVAHIVAKDIDEGDFAKFKYKLKKDTDDSSSFAIDENTGIITVAKSENIDYEKSPQIRLTVEAEQLHVSSAFSIPTTVTITLIDNNDNSPQLIEDKPFKFYFTKLSSDIQLCEINVTDADQGPNAEVAFSIEQPDGAPFRIETHKVNNHTFKGVLFTDKSVTDSVKPEYLLIVKARDQPINKQAQRSLSVPVQIRVNASEKLGATKVRPGDFNRALVAALGIAVATTFVLSSLITLLLVVLFRRCKDSQVRSEQSLSYSS